MRVLTTNELMRMTRIELRALAARITAELPTYQKAHRSALSYQPTEYSLRADAARRFAVVSHFCLLNRAALTADLGSRD